ncbi:hypothetical protein SprV_0602193100 [Sparganum proliferum]
MNAEWDKKIDVPVMLVLVDHEDIANDPQDPSFGYVTKGSGVTNVSCLVKVSPVIGAEQEIFESTREIEVLPATDACILTPENKVRSTVYDARPGVEITFNLAHSASPKYKMRLSMSSPIDEEKVILGENTLKFLEGALPGIYTVSCLLYIDNLEEPFYIKSEHNVQFIAPPTLMEIIPENPGADDPIFCVTNGYPAALVDISWTISDVNRKKFHVEKNVLLPSDFDFQFAPGSLVTIECVARFEIGAQKTTNTTSIKFTLSAYGGSILMKYNNAAMSLGMKLLLFVFCFLTVGCTLLAVLLPVLLRTTDTGPLDALNYHIHARLREQARRRALQRKAKTFIPQDDRM